MTNVFLGFLINHDTNKFTVIGTLSKEEELNLTNKLKNKGINYQRGSFNINKSVIDEIENMKKTYSNYEYVPTNELFDDIKFLDI